MSDGWEEELLSSPSASTDRRASLACERRTTAAVDASVSSALGAEALEGRAEVLEVTAVTPEH